MVISLATATEADATALAELRGAVAHALTHKIVRSEWKAAQRGLGGVFSFALPKPPDQTSRDRGTRRLRVDSNARPHPG
jgi:hypothetical protein